MVKALTCALIVSVHLIANVRTNEGNTTESCAQLYEKAVEAYLENRFEDSALYFEKGLTQYRDYRKKLSYCRLKCKAEADMSEPLYHVNVENLLFFENTVRQTLCIMTCERENPVILENVYMSDDVLKLYEDLKPYEYLHLCYYQTEDMRKAASSAFTYLVAHPDDKIMQSNMKHYLAMDKVDPNEIVNYEAKDYVYLYVYGSRAYEGKHWTDSINYMEESLSSYLQAEEECRALCEGSYDHGWYPDFVLSISNHFTVVLKCKQKCRKELESLNGEVYDDLLPSHYNYLQYAYYKLGKVKAACHAVASYLLFFPDDATMLANKEFYSKTPKVQEDYFKPREEALRYVQRQRYEDKLMKYISKEFAKASLEPQKVILENKVDQ